MSKKKTDEQIGPEHEELRAQLLHAAEAFSEDADALGQLLEAMVDDVERAQQEPLEIVPVAHHSPASGLHMLRRLKERAPKVIFIEMCEDLRELIPKLGECRLPIALQAFAAEAGAFPLEWTPLTVVAPLTEFGAEYQAMAWALRHDVELVFVDRSVDHIFQQIPQEEGALDEHLSREEVRVEEEDDEEEGISHGSALGVRVGSVVPTFGEFREFLLKNARVQHFAEWWEQYVEHPLLTSDWETYRRVMFLVGSLLRRLGRRPLDVESDRWRERYMWTRIKTYLADNSIDASDAMYVCGALHAVSDVEEYGADSDVFFDIPPATETPWLYGLIPSSYSAIERQFSHPAGTISLAETRWKKGLEAHKLAPFRITKKVGRGEVVDKITTSKSAFEGTASQQLSEYLTTAPALEMADEEQLLDWCVRVVKRARRENYMASTADSIAIYQTSMLLAGMRQRRHPTPYDFRDAAITCLEKSRVPGKHDIGWICDAILGGERTGSVGYASLPPLARDVYDRLEVLPINLTSSKVERALMDFKQHPEYLPASDLLWKLHYLIGHNSVVRPIMGERSLGHTPIQESWDISIGKNQSAVITLGYEGVTIEQVLELRLKRMAYGPKATTVSALQAAEDSILYLKSKRLTAEVGRRAVELLEEEIGATTAPEIFERIRRLVHYYRSQPDGLSSWIEEFVATGYSHYATLLPEAFRDRDTSPDEIAGMLGFIFTLESLALSLGCDRSELIIAVRQAGGVEITDDKLGLLWSAQYLLGERSIDEIRAFFDEVMENPMRLPRMPAYISGFVVALRFTPLVARLVVELLSKAFARVPDQVLMPWMPQLIMGLKPLGAELMPMLIKEAGATFPKTLDALDEWEPTWERVAPVLDFGDAPASGPSVELSEGEEAIRALVLGHRASTDAHAECIGAKGPWIEEVDAAPASGTAGPHVSPEEAAARALVMAHHDATNAHAQALGIDVGEDAWRAEVAAGPGEASRAGQHPAARLVTQHDAALRAHAELLDE